MTERRSLGEMLAEVADGAIAAAGARGLRATRVEVSLPVEIGFKGTGEATQVLADLPRFITRCDFDPLPSRMTVVWQEAAP
jgi:hypothetical protein